jgi:UDP-2-acetamido-3-amino-2,3-dideoxy-glucuronate N-acetyltransferase
VVTRDVPDQALVAGNPARRLGWVCACGQRLRDGDRPAGPDPDPGASLACPACDRRYSFDPDSGALLASPPARGVTA